MASPMKLRPGVQPSLRLSSPNPRVERLRERVRAMPQEPGVYRWLDAHGEIIYVGKAKNLKQRLRSYVTPTPRIEHFRKRALLENMADLEVTFCSTEMEALILEMHLIRTIKPRYNVSLTRERHYVYVRIGENETFPSVSLVHRKVRDGALYLGPYTNPWTQRRTLELLRTAYRFRTCSMGIDLPQRELFEEKPLAIPLELTITKPDRRAPCLDFHIRRCSGPCTGDILPEDYRSECVADVVAFYRGDTDPAENRLKSDMETAVRERRFERAAELRDALSYFEEMAAQRKIFDPNARSIDAFGFARELDAGTVLQVRGGNLSNEERLTLDGSEKDLPVALGHVITQFYASSEDIPDVIALPSAPDDLPLLRDWLAKEARRAVTIAVPRRGELRRLTRLAETNAQRKSDVAADLSPAAARV